MDLPLDDLIKSNRSGGRGRGGRRGGGDNRTGGGAFRRSRNTHRNNPYKNNSRGNSDDVWEHDRFDEEEEEEEIVEAPARRNNSTFSGAGLETGAKLQITNLAFSVSDDDIKDLFETLGDIKKAFVQYDKSGRSLGTATVIYARRADALEAIKKYNNVPLDESPMKISLVATASGPVAGGARRTQGGGGGGGGAGSARSFRNAVNEATRITVSVPNTGRRTRTVGGRRVVARGAGGARGSGRGARGGRGRGGRQVYVR